MPASDVSSRTLPLQGFLQGVLTHRLRGWAYAPGNPHEHVAIEVRVDGETVAQTEANQFFLDLQQHNIGDGDHGFLLQFEDELPAGQPERIEVWARSKDGQTRLLQMTETTNVQGAPATAAKPTMAANALLAAADPGQRPVFVVGLARSGTTAMVMALRHSGRYSGFNEGHFLPLAARLQAAIASHYARSARDAAPGLKTLVANVPPQVARNIVTHGFIEVMRATFPGGYWVDKTPGPDMIRAAPEMLRIWPKAKFICMMRRPIDNIESRRRKFPTVDFVDHCRLWAESMMAWHAVRDELAGACMELDHAELAASPQGAAARVAKLLDLTALETDRLGDSLRNDRPQQTGSELTPALTLARVDWSEKMCATFQSVCAEPARIFGYEADLVRDAG